MLIIVSLSLLTTTFILLWTTFLYRKLYYKLKKLDLLTGLRNGWEFKRILTETMIKNAKNKRKLSLIIIDVDDFKELNSSFGYEKADKILVQITEVIKMNKRSSLIFRQYLRGDEFLLLCDGCDINMAFQIAENIRNSIEKQIFIEYKQITVCCGVTELNFEKDNLEILMDRLFNALATAKQTIVKNSTILV